MKKLNRRQIIQSTFGAMTGAGILGTDPVTLLFQGLINGMVAEAHAADAGQEVPNNYVHIWHGGGPPHWMYDAPIQPNGSSDAFVDGAMLKTNFTNAAEYEAAYSNVQVGNYWLPHMWGQTMPTAGGTWVPMSLLAQNTLFIRGISFAQQGHYFNAVKQVAPHLGGLSLNGAAADISRLPIPSVSTSTRGSDYFLSDTNKTVVVNSNLNNLLKPFQMDLDGTILGEGDTKMLINNVLEAMKHHGRNNSPKLRAMFSDTENARKLFERAWEGLQADYDALKNKYKDLVGKSVSTRNMVGVNDQPVIARDHIHYRMGADPDVERLVVGMDFRDGFTMNSGPSGLVNNMAVAEYMLTNKLTNSVYLSVGSMTGLSGLQRNTADGPKNHGSVSNDAHYYGRDLTIVSFNLYYRAYCACLYEFVQRLKATPQGDGNMFDHTVIHTTRDHSRNCRFDGGGSDDGGPGAHVVNLVSGMIGEATVIGDIQADESKEARGGSWGHAAPMTELNNRTIELGHVASTVSQMVGMKSPTPNNRSLVEYKNGKFVPILGRPKNVA
jgi:hypothetical protein